MQIEWIDEDDWARFRDIRLASLRESPGAFETSYEDMALYPEPGWREQVRRLPTFIATTGDRDVGVVRSTEHPNLDDTVYLISMWVHPEFRRRGVGSALIERVVDWTREMCRTRVLLEVRRNAEAALALYRRTGFVEMLDGGGSEVQLVRAVG